MCDLLNSVQSTLRIAETLSEGRVQKRHGDGGIKKVSHTAAPVQAEVARDGGDISPHKHTHLERLDKRKNAGRTQGRGR